MDINTTVELLKLFEQNHLEVYVDGGWGVDALLGKQTRVHSDLDIALPHQHVTQLRSLLAEKEYKEIPRDDSWECNFVLEDELGHQVDVHSYIFDEKGNNIFGVPYKPSDLLGKGTINNYPVKCIPPDIMIEFHSGYELDANDYHDVKALCDHFGFDLPKEYKELKNHLIATALTDLKNEINSLYGFHEGTPRINYGPCGIFAKLFFDAWNSRCAEKVYIAFVMMKNKEECWHIAIRLPTGELYDGGVGIHTDDHYGKDYIVEDMFIYDHEKLEKWSYGLDRTYPRFCPDFDNKTVKALINNCMKRLYNLSI